ncbi:YybH family protein [Granulicella sibirica]|uniref:SnoaL-like domain-containing protein n=1 Tax=Granulicella sibirica TaxID=2479048 RepID=A0A4Q0T5A8_9BACT|nr:SgcJ/EcaC family oxidoreductase [Granulicella sibirica]RXH57800.1 hypothetical protein GRAN_1110 [Granulicella sibirica]
MRKRMLALGVLVLLAPALNAQKSADEAAVRAVIARETEGWDKFDSRQVASVFTEDAVWQNPFGVRLHGRADIEEFLTNLMARPGYRSATDTSATKILDLRMTSPTTASVWSDEQSKGQVNDASGHPMEPRHSYYLEVLVKKDGAWKISDCLIMDLIHLK